ncbi:hypothetical protein K2173_013449 [Erythroxylum novogranatense]|uniref:Protein kinase domain-containing protein n=1 Tax=Erythroxylum novogranatense TaxID=1862640 RepID=A0AAV8S9Y6_9ROSI|nr:hypothetical protein K2173_013449 [Erythroxylum novogranatense]
MEDCENPPPPSSSKLLPRRIDSNGPYRLLHCSSKGDKTGVMQELEKGVEPNLADYDQRTALHLASCEGCTEVVVLLLEKGAAVNSTDRWGRTPLSDAYSCGHEEICRILESHGGIDPGSYGEIYLVKWRGTEVAAKTIRSSIASNPTVSLFDILKRRGRLDSPTTVAYALDIARGMNYLHKHKPHAIIHRDLTPRNVLLDESGHLKVTDFGLSKIAQEKDLQGYKMTGGTGSYRYMAPEVYRRESYGKSVDVFSFALIVHEMLQGRPSNREELPEKVADKRAYEDYRPSLSSLGCPEPVKMLLRECWHKNPECRPTFEEIILQLEIVQEDLLQDKTLAVCCRCLIL